MVSYKIIILEVHILAVINKNTQKLLEDRYFFKDTTTGEIIEKTAEEMFKRVAKTVSKAEITPELQDKYEKIYYDLMDQQLFMPNTPTLIGAGYDKCLSACSVLPSVPDDLEEIYKHAWHNAKLTKYGCGVGQDLSKIRPKGEIIKSSGGTSAGVANWMNLINAVANTTIQGDKARRAANMISLRFNHPDIFEFVHSKENDGDLGAMNISIVITDEEMKKIKNDEDIDLVWNGKTYQTVKARKIFQEIIDGLYDNGEPGLLWLDSINANNPFNLQDGKFNSSNKHYMITTNPCFTGDMRLLTDEGYQSFAELDGKEVNIVGSNGNIFCKKVWCNGEKEVIKLQLSNGNVIKCTPNHILMLSNKEKCEAQNSLGKQLLAFYEENPTVISIRNIGEQKVYDFSEPLTNWGVVEGVVVHNCGEQPLEAYEFCNLGSINVENLYDEKTKDINWDLFKYAIEMGIRFLDDIIEINEYVLPQFKENVLGNRKIGLGVAGWANLLIKMGIRYDSNQCLKFIDKVFGFKQRIEREYNSALGLEKGNFPNWGESIYGKNNIPARCSAISTQAPTGSISNILNIRGGVYGVEPLFGVANKRTIVIGEIYEANELFAKMLHDTINDEQKEQQIIKECYEKGTAQISSVPKQLRELFRCANDISSEWHIKTQAQFQKYFDNAISKTINAPENSTKDELFDLLIKAWELKIKGITYYRNNSRKNQTIQIGDRKDNHNIKLDSIQPISRSSLKKTYGVTDKYVTACGSFYLTINRDKDGNIVESFVNTSKNGTCKSNIDGLNRLISLALRSGTKIDEIIDQLKGITCAACTRVKVRGEKKIDGLSCPDIIAKALQEEYNNKTRIISESIGIVEEIREGGCPDCGSPIQLTEGCVVCSNPDCGYSKCG